MVSTRTVSARALAAVSLLSSLTLGTVLLAPAAQAAPGVHRNAGDVWLDNVGQPSGPGHQMEPHLACADITLWGNGLADPAGDYTIDGFAGGGPTAPAYSSGWTYDRAVAGDQATSVIPVQALIANAVANGQQPVGDQGFHFKLQFTQEPQKHKTFWVSCGSDTGTGTSSSVTQPSATLSFTHECGFEALAFTNTTSRPLDVAVKVDGAQVDAVRVDPEASFFSEYPGMDGQVFSVEAGHSLAGADTYQTPERCEFSAT
jgi:hypothetical protein